MYKLLLCWRYLRTRYIALASIVSVTLGVATMIVVNSVMAGFTTEMQDRIHGILSDVVFESVSLDGMHDAEWHMDEINKVAGTIHRRHVADRPRAGDAQLRGEWPDDHPADQPDRDRRGDLRLGRRFRQVPAASGQSRATSFALRDGGYDALDHQAGDPDQLKPRKQMEAAGWPHRRMQAMLRGPTAQMPAEQPAAGSPTPSEDAKRISEPLRCSGRRRRRRESVFDPAQGAAFGRRAGDRAGGGPNVRRGRTVPVVPGDDVRITFPTATSAPILQPESETSLFTVVDFYESKMSEYDASFVFVPIASCRKSAA